MYFVRVHCRVLSAFITEIDDAYDDEMTYNMLNGTLSLP